MVTFRDVPELSVDLADRRWQQVELPLRDLDVAGPLARVGIRSDLTGDLYLADLRLVAGQGAASVIAGPAQVPVQAGLLENYPNPFNGATHIRFRLATEGPVRLRIFTPTGQRIATLIDARLAAGSHTVGWRGHDDAGRRLATGLYLARLETLERRLTRKLLLLR
jgi:hypothetical protein